ncbi:MAG: hypothetical protein IPM94_06995 [bacterium]|nr:hypothetical protein [bacterium]
MSGSVEELQVIEVKTGGEFWLWHTENRNTDPAKDLPEMEEYDRMKVTASAIQLLGFHEEHDISRRTHLHPADRLAAGAGGRLLVRDLDVRRGRRRDGGRLRGFGPRRHLRHPHGAAWTASREDGRPVVCLGCRKVTLHYELGDGVDVFSTGNDTVWYAPMPASCGDQP